MTAPLHSDRLIVFTKVPKRNAVKTRLIPLLGAEGALQAHREMTQHTLSCANRVSKLRAVDVEVHFAGGSERELRGWFPGAYVARPQVEGNLGKRMASAFDEAFAEGASHVVIVGTDCPALDEHIVGEALRQLGEYDLVLGPAEDGGYYLIGLSRPSASLFVEMPWSQSTLFDATVARAKAEGLRCFELKMLSDVDRPEDWEWWKSQCEAASPSPVGRTPRLSILIPIYRDNEALAGCLPAIPSDDQCELIVTAAEPDCEAAEICREHQVNFLVSERGRGNQLNAAAEVAQGEFVLFLHADCQLPEGFREEIERCLTEEHVVAGAFQLAIDSPRADYRFIAKWANRRARWLGLPYGDQGLFMRRAMFKQLGGFKDMPIMEDFEFIRRVARRGRIMIASSFVTTSERRWKRLGVWRVTLLNQWIVAAYYLGISPSRLAKWYRRGCDTLANRDVSA